MKDIEPDIVFYEKNQNKITQVNYLPWPLKSRTVSYFQDAYQSETSKYIVMYSSDDLPRENTVRAELVISGFIFTESENMTRVYRVVQLYPGGIIPSKFTRKYSAKTSDIIRRMKYLWPGEKMNIEDVEESK